MLSPRLLCSPALQCSGEPERAVVALLWGPAGGGEEQRQERVGDVRSVVRRVGGATWLHPL